MKQLLVLLLLIGSAVAQLPSQPVCNETCEPGSGSDYSGLVEARSEPHNLRGVSNTIWPKRDPKGPQEPADLPGSESYAKHFPLLHLRGRAGLDVFLAAHYNSRIWTVDKISNKVAFNADRDFPSYGFRIGYGYLERNGTTTNAPYVLTEADGTKRKLTYNSTLSRHESRDSSFINYDALSKTLIYKNGSRVTYQPFPSNASLLRPIKIKDTNGNYLSISYVAGKDQAINTVTDTAGRIVTFNYNGGRLTSIAQTTNGVSKTVATFTWDTNYVLNYNFGGALTVTGSPASGSVHNVLTGIRYANGTGYKFGYGDWGIVRTIEERQAPTASEPEGQLRNKLSFSYPSASASALADHPTYTQRTLESGDQSITALNWTFETVKDTEGRVTSSTVIEPSGIRSVMNLDPTGQVSSLQIKNSAGVLLKTIAYTWFNLAGANPRLTAVTTTLNDTGQQSKITYAYTTYNNVSEVSEYDFGLALKRTTGTTYLTTTNYVDKSCHILNLPTQVQIKDAAGNVVSRTNYSYDASAPTSQGGTNHEPPGCPVSSARGNLTRITQYASAAAGTGSVVRNFTFFNNGNVKTADVDCCKMKEWAYDPAYGFAYATNVTQGGRWTLFHSVPLIIWIPERSQPAPMRTIKSLPILTIP